MGSKTRLFYRITLTTKYRKNALAGIEQQVYAAFREIEKHSSFEILAMGIEHGNHIHIVIKSPPQFSVAGLVNRLQGYSLKHLWDSEPEHLSRFYWGSKRKLWHGGYHCDTVGRVSKEDILRYVQSQDGDPEKVIHQRG